jgi:DNA-binding NarL/FixJ family response regulator
MMDELSSVKSQQPAILVFDPLILRRAGFGSFLRSWAEQRKLAIIEATPAVTAADAWTGAECRMAMLTVGGSTLSGPEAQDWIERVRARLPDAPLVIVSDRDDPDEVVSAFRAGARGFIPTSLEPAIALQALTFILNGGSFFPPTALLLQPPRRCDDPGPGACRPDKGGGARSTTLLTPRQQAVLEIVREGKSNKVIARELGMRESTVKVHLRQIMRKLGASNRTQVALYTTEAAVPPAANGTLRLPGETSAPALVLEAGVHA